MKKRQGFVTNSSSSSFIVTFDKVPKCECEIRELLFGSTESKIYYDYYATTIDLAEIVFKDLGKPNDWKAIKNEFCYDSEKYKGSMDSWETCKDIEDREERSECWNRCGEHNRKVAIAEFKKFKEQNKHKFTFVVEYEDHSSVGAILEHGGVFDRVQHIRINKH